MRCSPSKCGEECATIRTIARRFRVTFLGLVDAHLSSQSGVFDVDVIGPGGFWLHTVACQHCGAKGKTMGRLKLLSWVASPLLLLALLPAAYAYTRPDQREWQLMKQASLDQLRMLLPCWPISPCVSRPRWFAISGFDATCMRCMSCHEDPSLASCCAVSKLIVFRDTLQSHGPNWLLAFNTTDYGGVSMHDRMCV